MGGDRVSLSGSTVVLMVVFLELASWDDRPAKEATRSRTLGLQAAVLVRVWRQACVGASQRTSLWLSCVLFKEIHENSPIKTSSLCSAYAPTLGRSPEIVCNQWFELKHQGSMLSKPHLPLSVRGSGKGRAD